MNGLDKLLEIEPGNAWVLKLREGVRGLLKKEDNAVNDFNKSLEIEQIS